MTKPDSAVAEQLDTIELVPDRPLIICDVDEVIVHFLRGLERHLNRNGYWLDASSFALNGNIRAHENGEPADTDTVGDLLLGYFDDNVTAMEMIDGARDALKALEAYADIIMLTNLPPRYRDARIRNLNGHGLDYPVIANVGPKGPTVEIMLARHTQTVVFIDDSPNNLMSVAAHTPHVDLVHFIQDPRFAKVAPPVGDVLLRSDNWAETHAFLDSHLGATGGAAIRSGYPHDGLNDQNMRHRRRK